MEQDDTDRRLSVPQDVKDALIAYADAERQRMENPIIKELITWKSLANKILKNETQKRGYWVPVKKA